VAIDPGQGFWIRIVHFLKGFFLYLLSDIFDIFKIRYFPYFFDITLLLVLDAKTSLKCENRHFKFSILLINYYLILKHFYRAMRIVQSAVLLLLLFLVSPFWNIQLKHKPFNWRHPIQLLQNIENIPYISKTSKISKISKISDIFDIFENIAIFSIRGPMRSTKGVLQFRKLLHVFMKFCRKDKLRAKRSIILRAWMHVCVIYALGTFTLAEIYSTSHFCK